MPYDNVISRTDAGIVPVGVSNVMLQNLQNESAAMSLFTQIRMSEAQTRMPVIAALPVAYFVSGDTGLKQTTEVNWENKYLDVAEIAAIVPIPDSVLDDAGFDVWGVVRPLMEQAIGRTFDGAVFFGTNKPAAWPAAIVTAATSASHTVTRNSTQANGGVAQDINLTMGLVEADGFDVSGFVTKRGFRSIMRAARDTTGQKLLDVTNETIEGMPVKYAMAGQWPSGAGTTELIAGDFSQGIVGIRQDITYKILDQAVIQDGSGAIIYNLAQQDMVAMRVVFRCAFQVSNSLTYDQAVEASRYPFAILLAP